MEKSVIGLVSVTATSNMFIYHRISMDICMSKKILVTVTDTHAEWLESIRKKKGVEYVQDVVRDLITTAYEQDKIKGG